jgi:hypothetical protein
VIKLSEVQRKAAVVPLCMGLVLTSCPRKTETTGKSSEREMPPCPPPGSLSVDEAAASFHGQRGLRVGMPEALRWLDEVSLGRPQSYRWVDVYRAQAWSVRLDRRATDCLAEARMADGRACTLNRSRVLIARSRCAALIACAADARRATRDEAPELQAWDAEGDPHVIVEGKLFHWFEGVDESGSYQLTIRDWSIGDACSRQWTDLASEVLQLPVGTVIP